MIRHPVTNDITALKHLWHIQFNDAFSYIDSFFNEMFNSDLAWLYAKDEEIASMIYTLPGMLIHHGKELPILYFYALASNPKFRGHAPELLETAYTHACKQGYAALVATVLDPKLINYYAQQGFVACSLIKKIDFLINDKSIYCNSKKDIRYPDSNKLNDLRKSILHNSEIVHWSEKHIEFQLNDCKKHHGKAISIHTAGIAAYALYQLNKNHALIIEYACSSIPVSKGLLRELCLNIPAKHFSIHTHPALLPNLGDQSYRGVIRKCPNWPETLIPSDVYINLGLSD